MIPEKLFGSIIYIKLARILIFIIEIKLDEQPFFLRNCKRTRGYRGLSYFGQKKFKIYVFEI
jgi:hypothetical protein